MHLELRAGMVHRARASELRMAAGMDHLVDGPDGTVTAAESEPDPAESRSARSSSRGSGCGS